MDLIAQFVDAALRFSFCKVNWDENTRRSVKIFLIEFYFVIDGKAWAVANPSLNVLTSHFLFFVELLYLRYANSVKCDLDDWDTVSILTEALKVCSELNWIWSKFNKAYWFHVVRVLWGIFSKFDKFGFVDLQWRIHRLLEVYKLWKLNRKQIGIQIHIRTFCIREFTGHKKILKLISNFEKHRRISSKST